MRNVSYPCAQCRRSVCDYRSCAAYRKWMNLAWKQFGRYENRPYWGRSASAGEKFLYIHPEVFRRYLHTGPCARCACGDICETPCRSYWIWWDVRMTWFNRQFSAGCKNEDPSRMGGVIFMI